MVNWSGFSIEEGKSVYAKGWGVKSRNNPVVLLCTSGWTWRKMEDNGISNEKLLVAKSDKRCIKIYRRI